MPCHGQRSRVSAGRRRSVVSARLFRRVRNVIDFGAFVDIGVHQDGLVHISEISDNYIRHPNEALKVGQIVTVTVIGVDVKKNRISLSLRKNPKLSAS